MTLKQKAKRIVPGRVWNGLRKAVDQDTVRLLEAVPLSVGKLRRVKQLGKAPIVIGGCGRSGTSLLIQILSCHSHIYAIQRETRAFHPDDFPRMRRIYEYLLAHEIPSTCTRWCEKTPANVRSIGNILKYFGPEARFIHIVRDGRDVCTSKHPKRPNEFWVSPKRWSRDVSFGLAYQNHRQVLTIRYEELVREYRSTVEEVCRFIGEPFVEDFMLYPDSVTNKHPDSWWWPNAASKRPIDDSSIGRWKSPKYKSVVQELMTNERAVALLDRLGYLDG